MFSAFVLPGHAQAWLPAQGEGVVSFVFQDQYYRFHVAPGGRADVGPTRSRAILADVTYGLRDKVAVSVGIPWIATKYAGPRPHPLPDFSGPTPIDDGTWHTTAQDFRFDVRTPPRPTPGVGRRRRPRRGTAGPLGRRRRSRARPPPGSTRGSRRRARPGPSRGRCCPAGGLVVVGVVARDQLGHAERATVPVARHADDLVPPLRRPTRPAPPAR